MDIEQLVSDAEIDSAESSTATTGEANSKQSRLLSRVLSPAIRLWLRSQLEHVEDLHFTITAGDRQLLAGCISQVAVSARKAVYQGLHLSQASIVGHQIRTNLGQVVRGKPLRLLKSFPIQGEVCLQEDDLNASLQAPLLGNAVIEFLLSLIQSGGSSDHPWSAMTVSLKDPQVHLSSASLRFTALLVPASGSPTPVTLQTRLSVENGTCLQLQDLRWGMSTTADIALDDVSFNLGSHVHLNELTLESGQIRCRGQIMVTP